tara:strand:+ start:11251 stop:11544 length:294 start_codon:yes stop_codon:yes gene_type:complete
MKNNSQIAKLVSAFISSYYAEYAKVMSEVGYPQDIAKISEESVFEMDGSVRISLERGLPLCYFDGQELLVKFMDALGAAHNLQVEVQNPGSLSVHNA